MCLGPTLGFHSAFSYPKYHSASFSPLCPIPGHYPPIFNPHSGVLVTHLKSSVMEYPHLWVSYQNNIKVDPSNLTSSDLVPRPAPGAQPPCELMMGYQTTLGLQASAQSTQLWDSLWGPTHLIKDPTWISNLESHLPVLGADKIVPSQET
jgi:hypothetical protein